MGVLLHKRLREAREKAASPKSKERRPSAGYTPISQSANSRAADRARGAPAICRAVQAACFVASASVRCPAASARANPVSRWTGVGSHSAEPELHQFTLQRCSRSASRRRRSVTTASTHRSFTCARASSCLRARGSVSKNARRSRGSIGSRTKSSATEGGCRTLINTDSTSSATTTCRVVFTDRVRPEQHVPHVHRSRNVPEHLALRLKCPKSVGSCLKMGLFGSQGTVKIWGERACSPTATGPRAQVSHVAIAAHAGCPLCLRLDKAAVAGCR